MTLKQQIRAARKAMKKWPRWMKETAYIAGSNHRDHRETTL